MTWRVDKGLGASGDMVCWISCNVDKFVSFDRMLCTIVLTSYKVPSNMESWLLHHC